MGLKELEKRLEQEPENLGLRVIVAGALRDAGRTREASAMYASVATAYRDQGRVQQAIAVCRSAINAMPDDAPLRALMESLAPPAPVPVVEKPVDKPAKPVVWPPVGTAAGVPRPPIVAAPRKKVPSQAPERASVSDATPLPRPVPYHVHDPTGSLARMSMPEMPSDSFARMSLSDMPTNEGADTRPGGDSERPSVVGIARAARRITAQLSGDLSAQLETREVPRVGGDGLQRLSEPPTLPTERVAQLDLDDDAMTPTPRSSDDEVTSLRGGELVAREPVDSLLFAPLPPDKRGAVLARFVRKKLRTGETIIKQGATSHALVLVVRGRLEVRDKGRLLEALGDLDWIGEGSILGRTPADAAVTAASDADLLLLSPHDLFEIAGASPLWWAHLKASADRRAREWARRR